MTQGDLLKSGCFLRTRGTCSPCLWWHQDVKGVPVVTKCHCWLQFGLLRSSPMDCPSIMHFPNTPCRLASHVRDISYLVASEQASPPPLLGKREKMRHCWSIVSREPGAEAKWDEGGVSWFRNFSLEHEWGSWTILCWSSVSLGLNSAFHTCSHWTVHLQRTLGCRWADGAALVIDEESIDEAQGKVRFSWLVLAAFEIVPTLVGK